MASKAGPVDGSRSGQEKTGGVPENRNGSSSARRRRAIGPGGEAVRAASTARAIQSRFVAELPGGTRNARNVANSREIPWASVS